MAFRITSAGLLAVALIAWQFGSAPPVWSQSRSSASTQSSRPSAPPPASTFLPQFQSLLNGPSGNRPGSGKSEPGGLPGGQPAAQPAAQPAGQPAALTPAMRAALQSTVRLRVADAQGQSVATGTIIDTHGSEALVITCGHVFRESRGQGRILVELFTPGAGPAVPGKLLDFDLQRDIGLLCIPISSAVPVSRVGVANQAVRAEQPVFSIGCDHGERPRVMESEIVGINQFVGPPNYTATHAPSEGRSGGGLFTADGLLIGICNAADPADDRGLFAALPTIHWQLDRVGQARIYGGAKPLLAAAPAAASNREEPVGATDLNSGDLNREELSSVEQAAAPRAAAGRTSAEQPSLVDELAERNPSGEGREDGEARMDAARVLADLHREAEAIVLIRSPDDPTGRVEVVSIERLPPDLRARLGRPVPAAAATPSSGSASPGYPAPSYAAPNDSAPSAPAAGYPVAGSQAPSYPVPSYPVPSYPTPTYPTPTYPTPTYPAPGYPVAGYPAPGYPAPGYPAPGYPAPGYPAPGYPAPGYSAPAYAAPPGPPAPIQRAQSPRPSLFGGWGSR